MRRAGIAAVLFAAWVSSGCLVLSLQPAYDAESVAFTDALVGTWINAEDQTRATIDRGEWRSYKVTYTDRFASRALQGNLTAIGGVSFLDLTEQRGADPGPFLVPVHGVFRIDVAGDTLTVTPFDYNWFARALTDRTLVRLAAAFDDRRNALVVSSTADFRRWLARTPQDAFAAPMTFARQR